MKTHHFTTGGLLFALYISLVPLTALAGGSSFSIKEINPQIRTLEAGKNNQLVKEFEVDLYNEDISSLNDMELNVTCSNGSGFKKVSVGQGTKTLGSSDFNKQLNDTGAIGTYIKTKGSEIKTGTKEKFWVKFDVADTDKTNAYICEFYAFNFVEASTGIYYDSGWSYEEIATDITPIVVIGSTQEGSVTDALEVSMKKLGDLTYKLGSQNQLVYMADVTANQDVTIDDLLFSCQDSSSLTKLTLKDQTAGKVLSSMAPSINYAPSPPYASNVQSVFFKKPQLANPRREYKTTQYTC